METIVVLPRTPPMAPAWLTECECGGGAMEDTFEGDTFAEDKLTEDTLVEDTLVENTLAEDTLAEYALVEDSHGEDVYTPGPRIAPGPNSGASISHVGVRP
jgi:hypothetical protein